MKTYLALCCTVLFCLSFAQAQQTDSEAVDYTPKKGDFTGAILFGRGNFLDNINVPDSPASNPLWTVDGAAPFANTLDANTNNIGNIAGGEARYFIKNNIALKAGLGFIHRSTPALDNIQRFFFDDNDNIVDGNDPSAVVESWIPNYSAVNENQVSQFYLTIGGEYHFKSRISNRISPYVGANLNYYSARTLEYDPTVIFFGTESEPDFTTTDIEERTAKLYGVGYQFTGGIDFYLLQGLYCGFEVRPMTFIYARGEQLPSPGLEVRESSTTTWAFFTQTHFKIGFRI
ncbi:MAG: BT1926 family outer membrane beta-barrel protein [Bacteroidota bacterium]